MGGNEKKVNGLDGDEILLIFSYANLSHGPLQACCCCCCWVAVSQASLFYNVFIIIMHQLTIQENQSYKAVILQHLI